MTAQIPLDTPKDQARDMPSPFGNEYEFTISTLGDDERIRITFNAVFGAARYEWRIVAANLSGTIDNVAGQAVYTTVIAGLRNDQPYRVEMRYIQEADGQTTEGRWVVSHATPRSTDIVTINGRREADNLIVTWERPRNIFASSYEYRIWRDTNSLAWDDGIDYTIDEPNPQLEGIVVDSKFRPIVLDRRTSKFYVWEHGIWEHIIDAPSGVTGVDAVGIMANDDVICAAANPSAKYYTYSFATETWDEGVALQSSTHAVKGIFQARDTNEVYYITQDGMLYRRHNGAWQEIIDTTTTSAFGLTGKHRIMGIASAEDTDVVYAEQRRTSVLQTISNGIRTGNSNQAAAAKSGNGYSIPTSKGRHIRGLSYTDADEIITLDRTVRKFFAYGKWGNWTILSGGTSNRSLTVPRNNANKMYVQVRARTEALTSNPSQLVGTQFT